MAEHNIFGKEGEEAAVGYLEKHVITSYSIHYTKLYDYHIISAEKRISSRCLVNLVTVPVTNQRFNKHFSPAIQSKELLALYFREIIKTTCQSQRFYVLLITSIEVDTLYKVEYPLERAVSSAFFT